MDRAVFGEQVRRRSSGRGPRSEALLRVPGAKLQKHRAGLCLRPVLWAPGPLRGGSPGPGSLKPLTIQSFLGWRGFQGTKRIFLGREPPGVHFVVKAKLRALRDSSRQPSWASESSPARESVRAAERLTHAHFQCFLRLEIRGVQPSPYDFSSPTWTAEEKQGGWPLSVELVGCRDGQKLAGSQEP